MSNNVNTEEAPQAIGPYSQAVISGNLVFCSGQISINPKTNVFTEGDITMQTHHVIENLKAVLAAAGSSLDKVIKTTVYLVAIEDFQKMNEVYAQYFTSKPARAAVAVKELPKGALVEIDCIAEK